jgi:hypothetical protein
MENRLLTHLHRGYFHHLMILPARYRPYYVDFAGIDDDGDSLVYSLTTPLNTTTSDALPPVSAGPYPSVIWRPGYGLTNIINGQPDLHISKEGLLTAIPRTQGLFVFAVKIDEYRAGTKDR